MKLLTPELCYHDVQPIYSCDIQPNSNDFTRLATGGLDNAIRLWKLPLDQSTVETPKTVELVANLCRHEKGVNVVRWSPSGKIVASASGDGVIILWERVEGKDEQISDLDNNKVSLEVWSPRFLRRHIQDIYDICWSSDDHHIISGSIDCSAIMWNVSNNKVLMLKDHKQFVQGVAWDPLENFVVTQSADRTFRVYRSSTRSCIYKVWKAGDVKLFQDGSWKFFFRRLQFSPDGKLLVTPAGLHCTKKESTDSEQYPLLSTNNDEHCAHIFVRNNLSKVAITIPTGKNPVIGVRFNPVRFTLRKTDPPVFNLPYRWIFCLVLDNGLLIYDTEQCLPIAKVSNIHFLSINDASWSSDGRCLVVCSTDGYCTFIYFDKGELGEPFMLAARPLAVKNMVFQDVVSDLGNEVTDNNGPVMSINMAMDSTEILARSLEDNGNNEDESSSDTEDCSMDDENTAAAVIDVVAAPRGPVPALTTIASTTTPTTTTTIISDPMASTGNGPIEKKRRLTLVTL